MAGDGTAGAFPSKGEGGILPADFDKEQFRQVIKLKAL